MIGRSRSLLAGFVAVVLVGTGISSAVILAGAGLWSDAGVGFGGPLAPSAVADASALATEEGARMLFNAQLSQPRDPFRPLITEGSPDPGPPGVGVPGLGPFDPSLTLTLEEIIEVGGTLRGIVSVNDESFNVGVGEEFAGGFRVVSLAPDAGVFSFEGTTFNLVADVPLDGGGDDVVILEEIIEVDDELQAIVSINGEEFTVGVGDEFADIYAVVSLDEDSGVFTIEGNEFTLDAVIPLDDDGNGNGGFEPGGTTILLVEIREVGGVLRATVTVDGTSYDVGVGDTFADVYKVVSLDSDSGVFLFGDSAFTLSEGQSILK